MYHSICNFGSFHFVRTWLRGRIATYKENVLFINIQVIRMSCTISKRSQSEETHIFEHIQKCENGKAVWDTLNRLYDDKG